ncbi:multidrug efflux transporter AcrB transmembrane domain-containing protein [Jaminaea rosea]|uniref:Multidrug efflux transporter AcrB transmembrane domain-containing protein n=1 Tax=Jaminaea rosea TaxID=1569628 RepID=A0A316UZE9_9BASI|nr:multidrug efflux transporter AcrB transmembrane domain-containing protein [Jaminaea rosea]PWN29681.1 multidrug efflux transporter AcrB transmembrane domain-containing protein [Jaminaea rosea]
MASLDNEPGEGRCVMRGDCGKASLFSPSLPCAVDHVPASAPDAALRSQIEAVCGPDLAQGDVCCTSSQVEALSANLQQAEALISSCPACRNNFRNFFCSFTCSPNQAQFLDVSRTQKTSNPGPDGDIAVKSVEYWVSDAFRSGFFDSCKDVKFGASNGFAMDLLGGGAKEADGFLKFMGDEKPLVGSPFQINFPHGNESSFDPPPRACSDEDLASRCACVDCPDVCTVLPHVDPPQRGDRCTVGAISCYSFALIIVYALALLATMVGYGAGKSRKKRRRRMGITHRASGISVASEGSGYERVRLSGEEEGTPSEGGSLGPSSDGASSERSGGGGLLGATGLGRWGSDATLSRGLASGPMDATQPRSYALANFLNSAFYKLGIFVTHAPLLTFAGGLILVALCNIGWSSFVVETDPVRLWVAPNSESKVRKEYFDEHFGPFYRTQQIFVMDAEAKAFVQSPDHLQRLNEVGQLPQALDFERLRWLQDVEAAVGQLRSEPDGYTLEDVCFSPTGPGICVVQSPLGYFQDDLDGSGIDETNWADRLNRCAQAPAECLPPFGAPLKSNVILGGIPSTITNGSTEDGRPGQPSDARSAVVTYVVNNSLNATEVAKAQQWERTLENFLFGVAGGIHGVPENDLGRRRRELDLEVSISTESSLQQELGSSSNTDGPTIVASYLLMFIYAALTLGGGGHRPVGGNSQGNKWLSFLPTRHRLLVRSKFTLGLFGIIMVLASVSSAIGLLSAIGVSTTLIIAEVLPFLVLAVGVDNIFLLSNEMDRQSTLASTANPYSSASLARSGALPSMPDFDFENGDDDDEEYSGAMQPTYHLSSNERAARSLGRMGPSILLSASTQISAFLIGALVPMPAVRNFALYAALSMFIVVFLQCTCFVAAMKLDADRTESSRIDCLPCLKLPGAIALGSGSMVPHASEGVLGRFIRRTYASTLVKPFVKKLVLVAFSALFVLSLIGAHKVEMGLDQRLALPADSYLRDYFNSLDAFLDVGPPAYFVSQADVTHRPGQQELCGRFTTCADLSVANVLEGERKRPDVSFIAEPASSWLDDFLTYLNPVLESCCRVRKANPSQFCLPSDPDFRCKPCFEGREPPWNITLDGMPEDGEFMRYLGHWLQSPTNEDCPLGGQASYSSAVDINAEGKEVTASHFRTYHTPLRSQADFIDALRSAERIVESINEANPSQTTFHYSIFAIFFDQYLHLRTTAALVLSSAGLAIFLITWVLLGSWRTSAVVVACVISAVTGVVGFMGAAGIGFNALTLVNLTVCSAICVEFQAHVAKAFMKAPSSLPRSHPMAGKERDERAWAALVDVGGSVLSGITGTKLVGISVLALTKSELLKLYYAKMWAALILLGALHGLVLLPVLLSYYGGSGYASDEEESEVRRRLLRAQDAAEYRPFTAEEDDDEEDDEEGGSIGSGGSR